MAMPSPTLCARSGLQLGIPIEEIHPAFMQMVRREFPALVLQFGAGRALWQAVQREPGLADGQAPLLQIAAPASGDDILPGRPPAMRARQDMIEGHLAPRS